VTTIVRALSVSSIETTPRLSAIFARPFGLRASKSSTTTRQAVRDVRAGDAAGVERPHGQLRARLADRLGGDDADRVADHAPSCPWPSSGRSTAGTRRRGASHFSDERTGILATVGATRPLATSAASTAAVDLVALRHDGVLPP
jgi:hypothetical protein